MANNTRAAKAKTQQKSKRVFPTAMLKEFKQRAKKVAEIGETNIPLTSASDLTNLTASVYSMMAIIGGKEGLRDLHAMAITSALANGLSENEAHGHSTLASPLPSEEGAATPETEKAITLEEQEEASTDTVPVYKAKDLETSSSSDNGSSDYSPSGPKKSTKATTPALKLKPLKLPSFLESTEENDKQSPNKGKTPEPPKTPAPAKKQVILNWPHCPVKKAEDWVQLAKGSAPIPDFINELAEAKCKAGMARLQTKITALEKELEEHRNTSSKRLDKFGEQIARDLADKVTRVDKRSTAKVTEAITTLKVAINGKIDSHASRIQAAEESIALLKVKDQSWVNQLTAIKEKQKTDYDLLDQCCNAIETVNKKVKKQKKNLRSFKDENSVETRQLETIQLLASLTPYAQSSDGQSVLSILRCWALLDSDNADAINAVANNMGGTEAMHLAQVTTAMARFTSPEAKRLLDRLCHRAAEDLETTLIGLVMSNSAENQVPLPAAGIQAPQRDGQDAQAKLPQPSGLPRRKAEESIQVDSSDSDDEETESTILTDEKVEASTDSIPSTSTTKTAETTAADSKVVSTNRFKQAEKLIEEASKSSLQPVKLPDRPKKGQLKTAAKETDPALARYNKMRKISEQ